MEHNNENIQILADSAFDAENYELAYNYYNPAAHSMIKSK